jgi:hypothetical protein
MAPATLDLSGGSPFMYKSLLIGFNSPSAVARRAPFASDFEEFVERILQHAASRASFVRAIAGGRGVRVSQV